MYKVYRCEGGTPQNKVAERATLKEAYRYAERLAANRDARQNEYRLFGPLPQELLAHMKPPTQGANGIVPDMWFTLDDVPRSQGALRASSVLRFMGALPPRSVAAPTTKRIANAANDTQPCPSPEATKAIPALIMAQEPMRTSPAEVKNPARLRSQMRFHVVRDSPQERITVGGEFTTRTEARAYITMRRQYEHDPAVTYIVEVGSPDSRTSRPRRSTRRVRNHQEREGRRERIYQEREGRRDLSLLARSDEELGLGIPAQWGKGRRSRKGDYIP